MASYPRADLPLRRLFQPDAPLRPAGVGGTRGASPGQQLLCQDVQLCRSNVRDGRLAVSGLDFRVFLLPPMTTIRTETLEKVKEFYDGGGTVVAFKRLPHASAE